MSEILRTDTSHNNENGEKLRAPLPLGWTYLIHGTDTGRWDHLNDSAVRVGGLGISAITLEDAKRSAAIGRNTTTTYSMPTSEGAKPVEVRIPFYRDDLSPRRGALSDVAALKQSLDQTTLALISRYHRDRHPIIPAGELLINMGADEENSRIVQYMVPASVFEQYASSVTRETGRNFSLQLETSPE